MVRAQQGYGAEDLLIGLLPGSREVELRRHLPTLLETSQLIRKEFPPTPRWCRGGGVLLNAAAASGSPPAVVQGLVFEPGNWFPKPNHFIY